MELVEKRFPNDLGASALALVKAGSTGAAKMPAYRAAERKRWT